MDKKTHHLPQIRVDEMTKKTWDEMTATVRGRELQTMLQIVVEDVAIFYRKTGIIFSVSKKISEKPDRVKKIT